MTKFCYTSSWKYHDIVLSSLARMRCGEEGKGLKAASPSLRELPHGLVVHGLRVKIYLGRH